MIQPVVFVHVPGGGGGGGGGGVSGGAIEDASSTSAPSLFPGSAMLVVSAIRYGASHTITNDGDGDGELPHVTMLLTVVLQQRRKWLAVSVATAPKTTELRFDFAAIKGIKATLLVSDDTAAAASADDTADDTADDAADDTDLPIRLRIQFYDECRSLSKDTSGSLKTDVTYDTLHPLLRDARETGAAWIELDLCGATSTPTGGTKKTVSALSVINDLARASPMIAAAKRGYVDTHPDQFTPELRNAYSQLLASFAKKTPWEESRTNTSVADSITKTIHSATGLVALFIRGASTIHRPCRFCGRRVLIDFDGLPKIFEAGLKELHFRCDARLPQKIDDGWEANIVSYTDVETMRLQPVPLQTGTVEPSQHPGPA